MRSSEPGAPPTGLPRIADVALAVLGLAVASPAIAAIALLVRLSSSGPVLHRAVRVGRHGTPFELVKFRTMTVASGPSVTGKDDPRITSVGRLLRDSKLDEIPQLLNVIRGEMSIVGPRPEDPRFVDLTDPDQAAVLSVRPGITSRASVEYRDEQQLLAGTDNVERTYVEQILPLKLAIDAAWLPTRTPGSDVSLIIETLLAVVVTHPDRRRWSRRFARHPRA